MIDWSQIHSLQLDIVGIVAILGDASITRNAQASALGWHHILPRLMPAPQALLKHEQDKQLPTIPGMIASTESGHVVNEFNTFFQLLHKDDLGKFEVQLVTVRSQPSGNDNEKKAERLKAPYGVKPFSLLALLSITGFLMSVGIIIGSVICEDGFALLAVVLLSSTSTVIGFASWCTLKSTETVGQRASTAQSLLPDDNLVVFYPETNAFRVIQCSSEVARLHMYNDSCIYMLGDNFYRFLGLVASVLLMAGLLSLGNSKTKMQIAFAGCYILLNILYWAVSAVGPTKSVWGHWKTKYATTVLPYVPPALRLPDKGQARIRSAAMSNRVCNYEKAVPVMEQQTAADLEDLRPRVSWRQRFADRVLGQLNQNRRVEAQSDRLHQARAERQSTTFTEAVWTAIALTGSIKWLKEMDICPDVEPWASWLEEAERRAAPLKNRDGQLISACTINSRGQIELPGWDWQGRMRALYTESIPKPIPELSRIVTLQRAALGDIRAFSPFVRSQLRNLAQRARQRVRVRYQEMYDMDFTS